MTEADPPPEERPPGSKNREPAASKEGPGDAAPPRAPDVPPDDAVPTTPAPAPRARPARPAGRSRPDRARQDAWVARLQEGDQAALTEVIAAYGERLTAVVAGILRDRDAVEDVVQATFAKAWFRIGSFKGDAGLYTWLYRVAVNATKDYIKGQRRRPALPLDEREAAQRPADLPHVIEGIARREQRQRVRDAIDALPKHYRIVLALRELEGMAYEEIAAVLGLSLGTVESRLFRARRRLKGLLERGGAAKGPRRPGGRKEGLT